MRAENKQRQNRIASDYCKSFRYNSAQKWNQFDLQMKVPFCNKSGLSMVDSSFPRTKSRSNETPQQSQVCTCFAPTNPRPLQKTSAPFDRSQYKYQEYRLRCIGNRHVV